MLEDLHQALTRWTDAGERVVVYMDANEDVRHGQVANMFRSIGFEEQITHRHGSKSPPPPTYNRNTHSKPIDGIWTNFAHGDLRCGYLAFGEVTPGDHHTAWIDISYRLLLGYNPPHLHRCYPSKVTTQDPRIQQRYAKRTKKLLNEQGILTATQKLRQQVAQGGPLDDIVSLHHSIRQARKKAGDSVASSLCKLHIGAFPCSPTVSVLLKQTMLWSNIIRWRKGYAMGARQIRRLMKKCKITDAFEVTVEEATLCRQIVQHKLCKHQKETAQWRKTHLTRLAEAQAAANNTTAAGELKSMQLREASRGQWKRIEVMHKKSKGAKAVKLYRSTPIVDDTGAPTFDSDGNPMLAKVKCNTKKSMEQTAMVGNESRFTRCIKSIFFVGVELFGTLFDGPAADQVRQGTFIPSTRIDPYARDFLLEVQWDPVPDMGQHSTEGDIITQEANSESWKKRQAGTASELSQLSFSHHITAAYNQDLSEINAALRSAPYQLGFSLLDWEIITDFQILRSANVYEVEKMHTIALMAALFNENNKKLGRKTMHGAEAANSLPGEQSGGCKNMRSNTTAWEKGLSWDHIRQQRIAATHEGLDLSQ